MANENNKCNGAPGATPVSSASFTQPATRKEQDRYAIDIAKTLSSDEARKLRNQLAIEAYQKACKKRFGTKIMVDADNIKNAMDMEQIIFPSGDINTTRDPRYSKAYKIEYASTDPRNPNAFIIDPSRVDYSAPPDNCIDPLSQVYQEELRSNEKVNKAPVTTEEAVSEVADKPSRIDPLTPTTSLESTIALIMNSPVAKDPELLKRTLEALIGAPKEVQQAPVEATASFEPLEDENYLGSLVDYVGNDEEEEKAPVMSEPAAVVLPKTGGRGYMDIMNARKK